MYKRQTLTKKMAESLTEFLDTHGIKVRYMHYDVDTIERMETVSYTHLGRKGPKISREACFKEGEKSSVYRRWRPYRKPTQVVRKRILRPVSYTHLLRLRHAQKKTAAAQSLRHKM